MKPFARFFPETLAASAFFVCCAITPFPADAASRMTMLDSVDAALAYSPELKAMQENRTFSEHAVRRAKAGHLPTVAAYGGGGYSRRSDSTTRSFNEDHSFRAIADAGLRLTQPLFRGFGTTHDVAAREAEFDSVDKKLEDRGMAVVFDAIAAHTEVARRRALMVLAQHNVKEHAAILNTVSQRYRTGVATKGELSQIQSRHARAKATAISYQAALDAARANYLRVVGQNAVDLAAPTPPKKTFSSLKDIRDAAVENHPRLKASLAEFKAAQNEKGQAKSRFFPHVDLAAGPSWSDRQSDADMQISELVGELRLNWELYSGGADDATVKMASAKIRQARHNVNTVMNALNEDIESTFSRYNASAREATEYASAKQASRAARDDYYTQFLAAQRSLLDVLDAENDYFYAASQEVLSRTDRILAGYRLLALAGTLLPELNLDAAKLRSSAATTSESTPDMRYDFNSPLTRGWVNGITYDTPQAVTPPSATAAGSRAKARRRR